MKLTINVCECDVMTMDELAKIISERAGWKILSRSPSTPTDGFRFIDENEGPNKNRIGEYDMGVDEITWADNNELDMLFGCDYPSYCGESLAETLDVSTLLWAEDENGNTVMYTEC